MQIEELEFVHTLLNKNLSKILENQPKRLLINERGVGTFQKNIDISCERYDSLKFNSTGIFKLANSFYSHLSGYCKNRLSFEDELRGLYFELRKFEIESKFDQKVEDNISILKALCLLFLGKEIELKALLRSMKIKNLDYRNHLDFIKLNLKNSGKSNILNSSPIVIINCIEEDNIFLKHLDNYTFQTYNLKYLQTSDYGAIVDISKEIPENSIVFINCHGNDLDDFCVMDFREVKKKIIYVNDIEKSIKSKDLQLLGILSCAHSSFSNLKNNVKHMIIPNKAGTYLFEPIVKSFIYHYNLSLDIRKSYELAKYSTLFVSINGYTINILPN